MTYGELETMVARVASWLAKHQLVSKGTVAVVYSTNCVEYPVIYLAVSSLGGIISGVNPTYTAGKKPMKHVNGEYCSCSVTTIVNFIFMVQYQLVNRMGSRSDAPLPYSSLVWSWSAVRVLCFNAPHA